MRNLVLTGFMGTGKSTVARLISLRYGLHFVDLDEEVERRAGRSIAEIFESDGEQSFRDLESQAWSEVIRRDGQVIATGGGTLVSPLNRELLTDEDVTLCLTCDTSALVDRLSFGTVRPLVGEDVAASITELLQRRSSVYALFPTVDTSTPTPHEVADLIGREYDLSTLGSVSITDELRSRVLFGAGALCSAGAALRDAEFDGRVLVVTDETVAGTDLPRQLVSSLEAERYVCSQCIIPTGEEHKILKTVDMVYSACLRHGLDRHGIIIGLGGGVVCDLAGFAAATYLRGVGLVLAPTSLLAQVDAAIGGKTGVDFSGSKNLVGAFYPAQLVLVDLNALVSLSDHQLSGGLSEVVKIGLMLSSDLFERMETLKSPRDIVRAPAILRQAIVQKLGIVQRDPREAGERALLNFGHTVGHAIEAATDYRSSHGQCVSIGMVAETALAQSRGICDPELGLRLNAVLTRMSLPLYHPDAAIPRLLEHLYRDKKRKAGGTYMALPTEIGSGKVTQVSDSEVIWALRCALGEMA